MQEKKLQNDLLQELLMSLQKMEPELDAITLKLKAGQILIHQVLVQMHKRLEILESRDELKV